MDMAQAVIFYAGWIFSVAWGTLLATVSVMAFGRDAFGRDVVPNAQPVIVEKDRR
jgi:hypothetical protein